MLTGNVLLRGKGVPLVMLHVALLNRIRQVKRRADERFGDLSRLFQYCFVGASGMVVDLSVYTTLQALLNRTDLRHRTVFASGSPLGAITWAEASAAFLGIAVAVTWNFAINRRLTFNDARRGSIPRQYGRYLLSNLVGCTVSFGFRLGLPTTVAFFAAHRLLAAVVGIVAATGISFGMARWFVFTERTAPAPALAPAPPLAGAHSPETRRDAQQGPIPAMHQPRAPHEAPRPVAPDARS